jgi:hypothetical protein
MISVGQWHKDTSRMAKRLERIELESANIAPSIVSSDAGGAFLVLEFTAKDGQRMDVQLSHLDLDAVIKAAEHARGHHVKGGTWGSPCEYCEKFPERAAFATSRASRF